MNEKALIDDKIPRFSYLNSYTVYCGLGAGAKPVIFPKSVKKADFRYLQYTLCRGSDFSGCDIKSPQNQKNLYVSLYVYM